MPQKYQLLFNTSFHFSENIRYFLLKPFNTLDFRGSFFQK
jgi:hypothetical protein